jgi:hypothetical protein
MEKRSENKGHFKLLENHSNPQFAVQTCVQINKDLQGVSLANVSLTNSKETTILEDLIQQLNPILEELAEAGKLSQFIYLVDLNEGAFKKSFSEQNFTELSYLVIEREAQKVYLRMKFSQQGSIE